MLGMIAGERLGEHKMMEHADHWNKAFLGCYTLLLEEMTHDPKYNQQQPDKPTNL
jgi:hypothetical protein